MVARSIHYSGPFRDKPFIPVDCGSLVPTLIESELFGYVKGAFTGANQLKDGLMAMAEGGTIFLDEVGELPVDLQAKMLRAIQEKEIRPVGSTRRVPINVRDHGGSCPASPLAPGRDSSWPGSAKCASPGGTPESSPAHSSSRAARN
jgi:transcriptional regulator of aromatic amino acid metabolism